MGNSAFLHWVNFGCSCWFHFSHEQCNIDICIQRTTKPSTLINKYFAFLCVNTKQLREPDSLQCEFVSLILSLPSFIMNSCLLLSYKSHLVSNRVASGCEATIYQNKNKKSGSHLGQQVPVNGSAGHPGQYFDKLADEGHIGHYD